ncbi:MAG: alpha/beta hydrolase [Rickettsiales bacterium]|jgi:pimeloyl-ACP methyl ester carboxylesterase|nr:alpha/beta hydrolase [Rickettsiales bacterium]
MAIPAFLHTQEGYSLAYHFIPPKKKEIPTIVFLGGLMSDMEGTKALYLDAWCREQGYGFIRFDYVGHGQSSGVFTDGTIGIWKQNALAVIDELTTGELLLVGSSLGGWIMVLAAQMRKERIKGLVGIAAAPDFTENLMWDKFDDQMKKALLERGQVDLPSDYSEKPYSITRALVEDGRTHRVLQKPIALSCPVRLLHGMKDDDVPYRFSAELAECLQGEDVRVMLLKHGDHRMSDHTSLSLLSAAVEEVIRG